MTARVKKEGVQALSLRSKAIHNPLFSRFSDRFRFFVVFFTAESLSLLEKCGFLNFSVLKSIQKSAPALLENLLFRCYLSRIFFMLMPCCTRRSVRRLLISFQATVVEITGVFFQYPAVFMVFKYVNPNLV